MAVTRTNDTGLAYPVRVTTTDGLTVDGAGGLWRSVSVTVMEYVPSRSLAAVVAETEMKGRDG